MSPEPRGPISRAADVALVVLFLAVISLPLLVQALGFNTASLVENRVRAARPELNLEGQALAQFPAKFEAYFNDSFGMRDQLIRWSNFAKVRWLGISSSANVLIGKRGWLYYTGDGSIDDIRHSRPLTIEQLEQWRQAFEAKRDWLVRRGIRYMVMFSPSKHTIYPEFVPRTLTRVHPYSRYDQLLAYLREHSNLELIGLREPLLKAKRQARIYYRRDTHWNDLGAFVAYQEIGYRLSRWFPGIRPMPRSAFQQVRSTRAIPDLSFMLGLGDILPERDYALKPRFTPRARPARHDLEKEPDLPPNDMHLPVTTECAGTDLPCAVVFRDSFFIALIPLLSEHFSRALYLWHCPFDPSVIERERPHVVIEEAVERRLWHDPPPPGVPDTMIVRKVTAGQGGQGAVVR